MTIIGRFRRSVHHYSIILLVGTRVISIVLHVQLALSDVIDFGAYFDFHEWDSILARLVITSSLLHLTHWKYYIYAILPMTITAEIFLASKTQELYLKYYAECEALAHGFDTKVSLMRVGVFMVFFSLGIYSHHYTLVSRFVTYK